MSRLIAQQRTDKNGKVVTRHVREGAEAAPRKPILAPPMQATVAGAAVSNDEFERGMEAVARRISLTRNVRLNLQTMSTFAPESFREVIEQLDTASSYQTGLWAHVLDWPNKDSARFIQQIVRELDVMEMIAELHPDGTPKNPLDQPSTTRGKTLWNKAKLELTRERSPRTVSYRKAVIFALWVKKEFDEYRESTVLKEKENLTYIAENLDAVMAHRDVIRQRGIIDRTFIESVVTTNAVAISEGVL